MQQSNVILQSQSDAHVVREVDLQGGERDDRGRYIEWQPGMGEEDGMGSDILKE